MIEIWAPRWHDMKVLIAKYKVCNGTNEIIFTKAKNLIGKKFYLFGEDIRKHQLETNGRISCYAVPFDSLKIAP